MTSKTVYELQSRVNSQMMVIDELRETNKRLKEGTEIDRLQKRIRELETQLRKESSPSTLTTEMLRRLKQLSHPDKHGNSELSNTVMKFLNSL